MRRIFVLIFAAMVYQVQAQDIAMVNPSEVRVEQHSTTTSSNIWQHDFDYAKKLAKRQNKPILVFFTGSDWCGPCKLLVSDFFNHPRFRKIARENLVLYEADFPRRKRIPINQLKNNAKLSGIHGVNSYPTVMLLNSEGQEISRIKGYTLLRETYQHFKFLKDNNVGE